MDVIEDEMDEEMVEEGVENNEVDEVCYYQFMRLQYGLLMINTEGS